MEKFVRGPFSTIEEVKKALDRLHHEGYRSNDLTVVANRQEDLDALQDSTSANVLEKDGSQLKDAPKTSFWENMGDTFSGFFFQNSTLAEGSTSATGYSTDALSVPVTADVPVEDYPETHDPEQETPDKLLASYKDEIEDGKIFIMVEDVENKEAKFNLDAVDDQPGRQQDKVEPQQSTADTNEDGIKNADPSKVMDETVTERDSHPDIDNDEEVLEQETTYVPTDTVHDDKTITTKDDDMIGVPPSNPDSIPTDVTGVDIDTDRRSH